MLPSIDSAKPASTSSPERRFTVSTSFVRRRHSTRYAIQYRDTQLTNERSWLARLRYTHENAVHHRLVLNAENYRWCSAAWFAATARRAFVETVKRVKIDRVKVDDDFGPVPNASKSGD